MADTEVFRFTDLPDELKVKVYEQYFAGAEIQICRFNKKKDNIVFGGMPSLNLEMTSKAICSESRKVRAKQISTTVFVSDEYFLESTREKFTLSNKYVWVRNHVQQLKLALMHSRRPKNQTRFAGGWLKLVAVLPNLESVDIILPCGIMSAPVGREDFASESGFQGWLSHSVRDMVDPAVSMADYELTEGWRLDELAVAMDAKKKDDKITLFYRRWAMSPFDPDECYFTLDTRCSFGVDGFKVINKMLEGDGIHACWHENRKTNPHVELVWESKEAKAAEADQKARESDIIHLIESLGISQVLIDDMD